MRTLLPAQISPDNFKAHSHSLTSRGAHASINSGLEQAIKSLVKYALKHQHARFFTTRIVWHRKFSSPE